MKLYKGRLPDENHPLMDRINRSLPFDIRLLPHDVATNRAWAAELCRIGIFSEREHASIAKALDGILERFQAGEFEPLPPDEDVHTLVERLLTEALGLIGARIHTGRSRNDQVVCDLRLFAKDLLAELSVALLSLIEVIGEKAREHHETIMAGTTHLQPALPITLGHFLYSLGFALKRDYERLRDTLDRVDLCPLGSGAMAGSGFSVDREQLARDLGFAGVLENSIDAVSDRDFCTEIATSCAGLAVHLSRYAEQFIIWANPGFGYVAFSGQWSTGSSMMPQKRNPDAMELVRGKAARIIGGATTLMTLTKGVPLSYAKDLQEDKEPLFDSLDTTLLVVQVFREALASATFSPERLAAALSGDMLATDLADVLAEQGVPFRQAHERVGRLVSELEAEDGDLLHIDRQKLLKHFPEFGDKPPVLSFSESLARRRVAGGTAPESLQKQAHQLTAFLKTAANGRHA